MSEENQGAPAPTYADREFDILRKLEKEPVVMEFEQEIKALVKKFMDSGQSGGSAPFVSRAISNVVQHLCMFEPLTPLTGEDSEWHVHPDGSKQNRRESGVFWEEGKGAYYIHAIAWREESGSCWGGWATTPCGIKVSSFQPITFPYKPETHYVDVNSDMVIKDMEQLKGVLEKLGRTLADVTIEHLAFESKGRSPCGQEGNGEPNKIASDTKVREADKGQ